MQSDPSCLESCSCTLSESSVPAIVLSDGSDDLLEPTVSDVWLQTPLYRLTNRDKELIHSPIGWLNDSIIIAAQDLIVQQSPNMSGLQPTTLGQIMAFQVHRGEFVQILHVEGCHWCTVSTVGCEDGVVNVYDSIFLSVSTSTVRIIASLVFSSAPRLVIRTMDVGLQSNSSNCGVLAITFAYDICSGNDPRKAKYDHSLDSTW